MRRNAQRRKTLIGVDAGDSQSVRLALSSMIYATDLVGKAGEVVSHDAAFSDLTDVQNTKAFRYVY